MNKIVKAQPRIAVLGGGFGGVEAALQMRARMPDEADIVLVSDKDYFLFRPNTIYVPFGLDPGKLSFHLSRPTHHRNISLITAKAREIDPISKRVGLEGPGLVSDLSYDYLVVATGTGARPEEIPGMGEHAAIAWTIDQMLQLRAGFHKLLADAKDGRTRNVLFLMPPYNKCSGPLYEMAMLLDTWLRRRKARNQVGITWSTCEESYIQAFGPPMHEMVADEFERRNITGYTGFVVDRVECGEVVSKNGERLPFDLLVSFPPYAASASFADLPIDERGFIATDLKSRQVVGHPDVYAVGDAADFPVKQAFLAFMQADIAAGHLSAQVLGKQSRSQAVARNIDAIQMVAMDELDGTRSLQVPLRFAGKVESPAELRTQGEVIEMYRAGSSPMWRLGQLGKMALGFYLPWRFKADNPFYSDVPWKGMEASLRLVSGLGAQAR